MLLMCECEMIGASGFSLSFMIPQTLGVNLVGAKQATTQPLCGLRCLILSRSW